ncbi:MAG: hypothetical protein Q7T89_16175 [Anaerolineales bacterium]|nr:hypothetical protein [Anaerolineales bacterium]
MPSSTHSRKPVRKNFFPWKAVLNASVIVAVFGCIGSIGAALLGADPFAGWLVSILPPPSLAALPATAVVTLPPVVEAPTDTAIVVPTNTPVPLPGEDWAGNCINSIIWKPYLAGETRSEQSECYQLSEWGIKAEQGRLIFASNRYSQPRANEYGILALWHNWTEVDFTVEADRLENSEIWFGFFEGNTLNSTGIVFVIQHGDVIDVRQMPGEVPVVDNVYLNYADGKFHPRINFEGGKIAVSVDGQGIISKWPINFTIRNMFIGYRALPSTNLSAVVFDLKFKP